MRHSHSRFTRAIALTAAVGLIAPSASPVLNAQGAPAPAPRAPSNPIDGGWPRAYVSRAGANIVIYEP